MGLKCGFSFSLAHFEYSRNRMSFDDFYDNTKKQIKNARQYPIATSGASSTWAQDRQLHRGLLLSGLFWTSTAILQRVSGSLMMHSGRSYPLTAVWGVMCTGASLIAANRGANELFAAGPTFGEGVFDFFGNRAQLQRYEELKQSILGLGIFSVLERRSFRTALPSSVISTGVYAHTPWHWSPKMSNVVLATSSVATSNQRAAIQSLGKLHGCHHCGSKQVFNLAKGLPTNFIADHMPPTKIVKEANSKWFRRILGGLWKKKQQLLPQCQQCFQVQGTAVRLGVHKAIYHTQLRSWHLSPLLGMLLYGNKEVQSFVDEYTGDVVETIDCVLYEPLLCSLSSLREGLRRW